MDESADRQVRASAAERQDVIDAVRRAGDEGRLTQDEVAQRVAAAESSVYNDELSALVRDLPRDQTSAVPAWPVLPVSGSSGVAGSSDDALLPAVRSMPGTELAPVARDATGSPFTLMGGNRVTVGSDVDTLTNVAVMGGNDYDLTDALGPGRVITCHLPSVMGGHTLYVPAGVKVVDQTTAVMAGNEVLPDADGDGSNGTLVLTGFLLMAGHEVRLAEGSVRAPAADTDLR